MKAYEIVRKIKSRLIRLRVTLVTWRLHLGRGVSCKQFCAARLSQREAARHFNISRDSVSKMMAFSVPPGYRRTAPVKRPKLDAFPSACIGFFLLNPTLQHVPATAGLRRNRLDR